jgi:transposase InsO family protein
MPNVLNREFSVTEPSKVWVLDITYTKVKEGFFVFNKLFLTPRIERSWAGV